MSERRIFGSFMKQTFPRMNSIEETSSHLLNYANAYVMGCTLEDENRILKQELRRQMDSNRRKNNKLRGLRKGILNYRAQVARLQQRVASLVILHERTTQ